MESQGVLEKYDPSLKSGPSSESTLSKVKSVAESTGSFIEEMGIAITEG